MVVNQRDVFHQLSAERCVLGVNLNTRGRGTFEKTVYCFFFSHIKPTMDNFWPSSNPKWYYSRCCCRREHCATSQRFPVFLVA